MYAAVKGSVSVAIVVKFRNFPLKVRDIVKETTEIENYGGYTQVLIENLVQDTDKIESIIWSDNLAHMSKIIKYFTKDGITFIEIINKNLIENGFSIIKKTHLPQNYP